LISIRFSFGRGDFAALKRQGSAIETVTLISAKNRANSGNWRSLETIVGRFDAADDVRFAYWLVRDADSRLNIRDRLAVDAWIESGKPFHVMRDHPWHTRPIMGCSCGGVGGYPGGMIAAANAWPRRTNYCDDEAFLAEVIWPRVKKDAMVHDGCCAKPRFGESEVLPFPRPLEFGRYVGERCHEDEHWRHNDRDERWMASERSSE
jgi:hypothetical protein